VTEHKCFVFTFADVEVREREFCIVKAGELLQVEPKAFRVLLFLLRSPHRLIAKDELLDAVWNDCAVSDNSLTRSIALLRRLLGDDTREPRYIATVPTVGYRFLCDVQVAEDGFAGPNRASLPNSQNSNEENSNEFEPLGALGVEATPPTVRETAKRWKMIVPVAAAALVLAIAAAFLYRRSSPGHGATSKEWEQLTARFLNRNTHAAVASLAVLPLTNLSGDPNEEYFADGMTDELTTMLAKDSTLRIVSSTSAMQFKDAHRSLPENRPRPQR
jgi:DNA-binding winged helix-turn-helix (wHTH) protein